MAVLVTSQPYTLTQVITNPRAVTNRNMQSSATKPLVIVRVLIDLAQATVPSSANSRVRHFKL